LNEYIKDKVVQKNDEDIMSMLSEEEQLKYKNLIRMWLESRNQPQPFGLPIQQYQDTPAYFLKPKDMSIAMNALTPYDLYNKPNDMAFPIGYTTIGYNQMGSPDQLGVPRGTTMFTTEPNLWYGLRSYDDFANQYPQNYPKELLLQGAYEHEAGHTMDTRLVPPQNKGYLKRWGLEGSVANREAPALQAEQDYWQAQLGK